MISYIRVADGHTVSRDEACEGSMVKPGYSVRSKRLIDGEGIGFDMAFMDSAAPSISLRDSAGQPVTLHDRATGGTMKLTADHITAIESEAGKAGLSVAAYVADVLRYVIAP